jgi:hypothetical protein
VFGLCDLKALWQVQEANHACACTHEEHIVGFGEARCRYLFVLQLDFHICEFKAVFINSELCAEGHHNKPVVAVALLVFVVRSAAFVNENVFNFLVEDFCGPDLWRLLFPIVEVPKANFVRTNSAQLVIVVVEDHVLVVRCLPPEEQFLRDQIVLEDGLVNLHKHEVALRLGRHLHFADVGLVVEEVKLVVVKLNALHVVEALQVKLMQGRAVSAVQKDFLHEQELTVVL